MTIDERLERLTERHEAWAESIELMRAENERTAEKIRILATVADQNETRAARNESRMVQMVEAITSLARTVEEHQRRMDQAS